MSLPEGKLPISSLIKMPTNPLRYSQKLPITTPPPPPPPPPSHLSSLQRSISSGTDNRIQAISFSKLKSPDSGHSNNLTKPYKNGYSIQLENDSAIKPTKQWWKSNITKLVGSFLVGMFCISIVFAAVMIRVQASDSSQVSESRSSSDVANSPLNKRDTTENNQKNNSNNLSNGKPIDRSVLVVTDDNLVFRQNLPQNDLKEQENKPIQVPIHVIFDPLPSAVTPVNTSATTNSRNYRNTLSEGSLPSTSTNKASISPQVIYETDNSGNFQSTNLQTFETKNENENENKIADPKDNIKDVINTNNTNNNNNNENINDIFATVARALRNEDGSDNPRQTRNNSNSNNNWINNSNNNQQQQQQQQQQIASNSIINADGTPMGDNAKNGKYVIHMDIKVRKQE